MQKAKQVLGTGGDSWKPKYLICSGGGLKGLGLIGVLEVLHQHKVIRKLEGIAATSIGGLVCAMSLLTYTHQEMIDLFLEIDFSEFINSFDIAKIITSGSLSNGTWCEQKVKMIIRGKLLTDEFTMLQLYESTGVHLILFSVRKSDGRLVAIDHLTMPDLMLWKALLMTMAVPFLFKPIEHEGDFYYDGGVLLNYPMCVFPCEESLGIRLGIREKEGDVKNATHMLKGLGELCKEFMSLIQFLIGTLQAELEYHLLKKVAYREIQVETGDTNLFSFNTSKSDKLLLVENGRLAATAYLQCTEASIHVQERELYVKKGSSNLHS